MAKDYKFIQEDLRTTTGTEGTLLIPRKIHDQLWPEVEKNLLPRELAAIFMGPGQVPGSSIDINFQTPDTMDVRVIGEGAEVWLDQPEFTTKNIKPVKYGVRINITREMMEDSQFDLLRVSTDLASKRFAENMNSKIISDALDDADATTSGGAAITIANITAAMQGLEDDDFTPTDFIVGNEVANDLRNIDTFVEADKSGVVNPTNSLIGTIFGMRVHRVSTNAGMTATSAYVLDRRHSYVVVEKRPVTVEAYTLPTHDTEGVAITHRFAVESLRSKAIQKITTS